MSSAEPTTEPTTSSSATPSPGSSAGTTSRAVRDAIVAANARFSDALRAGDADALAACYTADAQLLPVHSEPVVGTAAIAGFWRGALEMGVAGARLETVEVESAGDLAVEVGRYSLAGADGGAIDSGKYVVVWHRDGASGAWKLHRDIWTTSRPAAAAPGA